MRPVRHPEDLKPFPPPFHSSGRIKTSYLQELNRFQTVFGRRLMVICMIGIFGLVPLLLGSSMLHMFNLFCIYAIVAIGLTILTGYTGQVSLAHGALFGVGAYTGALLAAKAGLPFFLALIGSGIAATLFGALFAIPTLRLKSVYLPIATLAAQFILEYIMEHRISLTGGSEGLAVPKPTMAGLGLRSDLSLFYFTAACLLIIIWLSDNLLRGKIGRAFHAIKQNARAAAGMGIDVYSHKLFAFLVSSFLTGLAGALFAYSLKSLAPAFFGIRLSIEFLAVIIIGGLGCISGAIIGSAVIVLLRKTIDFLGGWFMTPGLLIGTDMPIISLYEFILGCAIILFVIFKPDGLASFYRKIVTGLNRWPFS